MMGWVDVDQLIAALNRIEGEVAALRKTVSGRRHLAKLSRLRQILATSFNEGELRDLCFDLGVDYDDLRGDGKADKARELVTYFDRRGHVSELVRVIKRLRPNVALGDTLEPELLEWYR